MKHFKEAVCHQKELIKTVTIYKIKKLVKEHPNDKELGAKVRELMKNV